MAHIVKLGAWAAAALLAGCGGGSDGGGSTATTTCPASAVDAVGSVAKSAALVSGVSRVEPMQSVGTGTSPIQLREASSVRTASISLGVLSEARVAAAAQTSTVGVPRRIGLARDVLSTSSVDSTSAVLDWQSTASGGKLAAISFSSEEAKGLRLGVLVKSLPAQATLRVYVQGAATAYVVSAQSVLDALQRNLAAGDSSDNGRTYWTPLVEGQEATLEIELPAQVATDTVQIAVPRLSHLLVLPQDAGTGNTVAKAIGDAGSCEVDVSCNSSYSSSESNAVARMVFTSQGASYQCSGTLLNDTTSSGTPYFLSANHCISTQAEASSLQTYWFYRAGTCNSGTLSSASTTRTGGATLLYASANTDTSFMRLIDTPPTGAMFAGWLVDPATVGATVAGLHFPEGDLQKVSTGTVESFQSCSAYTSASASITCSTASQSSANYLNARFTSGATEEGSSGSPLFQTSSSNVHYLVGQLFGGSSSCTNTAGSNIYGRFDVAYTAALSRWLASTTTSTCQ
jgi:lysyl endopeptidase